MKTTTKTDLYNYKLPLVVQVVLCACSKQYTKALHLVGCKCSTQSHKFRTPGTELLKVGIIPT